MSSVLTGAYGSDYNVHMYFVSSIYGYFLKPFYMLFPKVGWYFIFELFGTFAAFTTFTYFILRHMSPMFGFAMSAILLASFTPDFYFQLSFTQCATIYTAAGLVAFFFAEGKKRFLLPGCLFLIAGSTMRWEGFLLGMPYVFILFAVLVLLRKKRYKITITALTICLALIYGLHSYDRSLFSNGDYKYYAEYQPVRSFFGDGAYYDREATFDELQERGMNGHDFRLLKSWMFYDTKVFHRDSLLPIIKVAQNNLYTPNPSRMPIAFFMAISRELTRSIGWCWAIFCILLIFTMSRASNVYPWISLGIIAISIGYLLLLNRLAYHVESGIWLYAVVCSIPFLPSKTSATNHLILRKHAAISIILLIIASSFAYFGITEQNPRKTKCVLIEHNELPTDWKNFLEYVKQHKEDVFLLSFDRYKVLGTFHNPPYKAIEPGSLDNIFPLGYWNMHLPAMKQEFQKRGVLNPVHDIVHENVFLLEDFNKPMLQEFYKTHYGESLQVDTVKVFGELMLLKYRTTTPNYTGDGI